MHFSRIWNRFTFRHNNPVLLSLLTFLGLITLSDAFLSYWVPGFIENTFNSPALMGLIMSFSSVVGLITDAVLPQVLNKIKTYQLMFLAAFCSSLFVLLLILAKAFPIPFIFIIAVGVWGIYYEFIGFSTNQYVGTHVKHFEHTQVWSVIGALKSLTYFLGPLLIGYGLIREDLSILGISLILILISGITVLFNRSLTEKVQTEHKIKFTPHINLIRECSHWRLLLKPMWTIIVLSVFIGVIDSVFWTVGAVWSTNLIKQSSAGGMLLSTYMLPSLFMGFILARIQIHEHKKKIAELFFLLSSAILIFIGISDNVFFILGMVFLSSLSLAISIPLIDAVYSDFVERMGEKYFHLIGLTNATYSFAYIVGPIIGGIFATYLGEQLTFTIIGIGGLIIGIIIYLNTPRKIHVPQKIISSWK